MLIYPQTITCKLNLIKEVDEAILCQAKKLRDNLRFGFQNKIKHPQIKLLTSLRDIYYNKINNANWLCDFTEEQVVSSLQRALRNI